MTIAQRKLMSIQKAQSFIRTRVLKLRGLEEAKLTPEVRTERDTLDRQYGAGEEEYRHALSDVEAEEIKALSLSGGDTEDRERRELVDRSDLSRIFGAVLEHRALNDGRNQRCKKSSVWRAIKSPWRC